MLQAFYTKKLEVVLVGLENRYGGPDFLPVYIAVVACVQ
jgi:hypothetical protein